MVDPTILTPAAGAGGARSGFAAPSLLRPTGRNLIGGTAPSLPSNTPSAGYTFVTSYHVRQQPAHALIGGTVFVIADSIHEGQPVQLYSPFAENYGIGGDTIEGVLNRVGTYTGMTNGAATILNIGLNNTSASGYTLNGSSTTLAAVEAQYLNLLNWLSGPLVWIKIFHTNNGTWNGIIDPLNAYVTSQLSGRSQCAIVDVNANNAGFPSFVDGSGVLLPANTLDGQHLSGTAFVNIVAPQVRNALAGLGV